MRKVLIACFVIILAVVTFFPRGVELVNHNYLFLFDQGRDYLAAKGIANDHKFTLIGAELGAGSAGISGIFHGPIYYYLLTIPFILFHADPYGGVVLMFLFSIAAIIAGFFLGGKLWGLWGGLLVAFLFAVSPPLISQARFIWSPNLPTVFIVIAFFFVYQYLVTRNKWAIFFAAFFSGFVYNFEFALAIPMVLTLLIFSSIFRQKSIWFYLFLGLFLSFLPMIFFEMRHNFLAVHGVISYFSPHKVTPSDHETFFNSVNSHWGAFFNNVADAFPHRSFLSGSILLIVLLVFSCWYLLREKNKYAKYFFIYLLLLLLVTIIVFGFLRNAVYHYYLTDLTIVYILLFVYCFYSSWKNREFIIFALFSIYLSILFLAAVTNAIQTWEHDKNDYGGTSKIRGLTDAFDFIYRDAKDTKFGLLFFAPPVYTYQYDYMEWWYAKAKYHYLPHKEKKGIFYLLIEPDPAKPLSYQGWLDTVIRTGHIISTTTLPSGFIVQKRHE